jgi:hypothetical protein
MAYVTILKHVKDSESTTLLIGPFRMMGKSSQKKTVLTTVAVTTMTVMTAAGVAAMVMAAETATGTVMTAAAAWGVKRHQSTCNPTH